MSNAQMDSLKLQLFEAIENDNAEWVKKLIGEGANPDAIEGILETPAIVAAAENESLPIVKALLAAGARPDTTSSSGETALTVSARSGLSAIVNELLEAGADPNVVDSAKMTPLLWTAHWSRQNSSSPTREGSIETVKSLLRAGATANLAGADGVTPLMIAARLGERDICEALMEAGADPTLKNGQGLTAADRAFDEGFFELAGELGGALPPAGTPRHLFAAIKAGSIQHVEDAISAGVDIESRDDDKYTALMRASEKGLQSIVRLLLDGGAEIDATNSKDGPTPLILALWHSHKDIAIDLLNRGASPHSSKGAALRAAAGRGYVDIVKMLLAKGVPVNSEKGVALLDAARQGYAEVVDLLIEAGLSPDIRGEYRETPLIIAAREGHEEVAKVLIGKKASVDIKADGWTALHWAADGGHSGLVRMLMLAGTKIQSKGQLINQIARGDVDEALKTIEKGAPVDVQDSASRWSALIWCSLLGQEEILKVLLAKGASMKAENAHQSALAQAARLGRSAIVKSLLEKGALSEYASGGEALADAARCGHAEVIRLLLQAGVDPDTRERGRTPLHLAAAEGKLEAVRALVERGADLGAKTALGLTAADEAEAKGFEEVARYLKNAADTPATPVRSPEKPTIPGESASSTSTAKATLDPALSKELLLTVQSGDTAGVRALLDKGADPGAADERGIPAGALAIAENQREILPLLLEKGADSTAILKAISFNEKTLLAIKYLCERGADANVRLQQNITPLMMGAMCGSLEIVKTLLNAGADVNAKGDMNITALHQACGRGNDEVALALLKAGAAPDIIAMKSSPLSLAAARRLPLSARVMLEKVYGVTDKKNAIFHHVAKSDLEGVAAALSGGTKVDCADPHAKWTPLLWAALLGEREIAQKLVSAGAEVGLSKNSWTPLALSHAGGHMSLCEDLIAAGASVDVPAGPEGMRLLHKAVFNGDIDMVRLLIRGGAGVDAAVSKSTALHMAAQRGDSAVAAALIDAGAGKEARDYYKATPLVQAMKYGKLATGRLLLEKGASPDAKLNDCPILGWMLMVERREAIDLLLEYGASAKAIDREGRSMLHIAAAAGLDEWIEPLIKGGASPGGSSKSGRTPLMEAAALGRIEPLQKLLGRGANPLQADNSGRNAIDEAALEGESEAVSLLGKASSKAPEGRGRLWLAIAEGDLETAKDCLKRLMDFAGISPLLVAVRSGRESFVELLLNLKPQAAEIKVAREEAESLGYESIARLLGEQDKGEKKRGIRQETIDEVMKKMPLPELSVVLEGEWSRFLAAPGEAIARLVMNHQAVSPYHVQMEIADMDEGFRNAGLPPLGNLLCERIRDVYLRCYGSPELPLYAVWNVGLFAQSLDLVAELTDGTALTLTTQEKSSIISTEHNYTRSYPFFYPRALFHKLGTWVNSFRHRGLYPGKGPKDVKDVARQIDAYLVRRFSK